MIPREPAEFTYDVADTDAQATDPQAPAAQTAAAPDPQTFSDTGLAIYEAIATLEYSGRYPSRSAIIATVSRDARLSESEVSAGLDDMTAHGLLAAAELDGEAGYLPASRDWSTQPGLAAGHPMHPLD